MNITYHNRSYMKSRVQRKFKLAADILSWRIYFTLKIWGNQNPDPSYRQSGKILSDIKPLCGLKKDWGLVRWFIEEARVSTCYYSWKILSIVSNKSRKITSQFDVYLLQWVRILAQKNHKNKRQQTSSTFWQ